MNFGESTGKKRAGFSNKTFPCERKQRETNDPERNLKYKSEIEILLFRDFQRGAYENIEDILPSFLNLPCFIWDGSRGYSIFGNLIQQFSEKSL